MKFANSINGLVVQFVKLDLLTDDTEVLVMERLYPIDFRAFQSERRQLIFEVFEDELIQLHKHGCVHRDILICQGFP